jgi:hypothetical protein
MPSRKSRDEQRGKGILDLVPTKARVLLGSSGREMVRALGTDTVRGVVLDVLCGRNLRDSTEMITRKRIASLNAATFYMFLQGQSRSTKFIERLAEEACNGLKGRHSKENRWILQWTLGLTDKAYQNVLRDKPELLDKYTLQLNTIYGEVSRSAREEYGQLSGRLSLPNEISGDLDWEFIIHLLGTVGTQTLAIRGSEKSTYGKVYERLILGSLLHILGFELVDRKNPAKTSKVFWLSSQGEKRESDATALYEAGKGVRFDIGFIGRGNPEISLDKVTRFEHQIEFGNSSWYTATLIIVDRIGPGSKIAQIAKSIGADIVQMSLAYWPKQVAQVLKKRTGLRHELAELPNAKIGEYLAQHMRNVPLDAFVPAGRVVSGKGNSDDNAENESH